MGRGNTRPDENTATTDAAEADVYEQQRGINDDGEESDTDVPDDVDPADAHEQQLSVDFDEDDYR